MDRRSRLPDFSVGRQLLAAHYLPEKGLGVCWTKDGKLLGDANGDNWPIACGPGARTLPQPIKCS